MSLVDHADTKPTSDLRILLVEDHHDSAVALSSLLRSMGHFVQVANTIASARQIFDRLSFDLLLCDLGLPDGDGCDLLRELRRSGPVRAIAVTGFGMPEDIQRCLAAGFLMHLTKPLVMSHLQQLLHELGEQIKHDNAIAPARDNKPIITDAIV